MDGAEPSHRKLFPDTEIRLFNFKDSIFENTLWFFVDEGNPISSAANLSLDFEDFLIPHDLIFLLH